MSRDTITSIDVLHESTINDYWNIDGDKLLSEPGIGVTRFERLNKDPPEGHVGSRQIDEETGYYKTCTYIWREEWSRVSKIEAASAAMNEDWDKLVVWWLTQQDLLLIVHYHNSKFHRSYTTQVTHSHQKFF